jgi:diguanylate cyclase (GGDEF)-like protein/PAS domain S-box-containing protein
VTLQSAIQWIQLAVFVLLAVASVIQWLRRRGRAGGWLALTFAVLGTVVVAGEFVSPSQTGAVVDWVRKGLIVVLLLFPYCLYRFTGVFWGPSPRSDRMAGGVTILVSLATLALPRFVAPGQPLPPWLTAYGLLLLFDWTVLSTIAVARLWLSGSTQATIAKRRMQTLGLAAATTNISLLVAFSAGNRTTGALVLGGRLVGLAATAMFMVGFAPPPVVRRLWRRRDVAAFRLAESDLMRADTAERVTSILLPHATTLVGARAAVLVDADGALMARHGVTEEEAAAIAARLPTRSAEKRRRAVLDDIVAVRLRSGWLAMVTTEATPFFGAGEVELLDTLVHFAGLALDRAELFDRERLSRRALAERERQLAKAQQTAQMGSYERDLKTGQLTLSDEMLRLLEIQPHELRGDVRANLRARTHPDDLERIAAAMRETEELGLPSTIDYRVILPSGAQRWMQARTTRRVDANGTSVVGTMQDITDAKEAELALRESEMRFRLLVDGASDYAIYMLDPMGRVTSWNAGAERIKGYKPEEIIGEHFSRFYPPEDVAAGKPDLALNIATRDGHFEDEGWRLRKDGVHFVAQAQITAIRDDGGVLQGFAKVTRDVTERKRAEEALSHQALHDPLTGLPNRRLFSDRLAHALARRGRRSTEVAVVFLDLDRFKWMNDSLGHSAGDQLLVEVAARLVETAREGDTVARFGGDEFVVLMEEVSGEVDVIRFAERLAHALATPVVIDGTDVTPTVSIGVAMSSCDRECDAGSLMRDADAAMYQAKERGGDRYELFGTATRERVTKRLEVESELRRAIHQGDLEVYYHARPDSAGRVHPRRRGNRADRAARCPRAPDGLLGRRHLAEKRVPRARRRQSVAPTTARPGA